MIHIFKTQQALAAAAAELFVDTATEAIAERGKFTVALTGGSSPAQLYALLATEKYTNRINWRNVFVFWGDERWVPINDEKSNAGMANRLLLDLVAIPKENIFPMWTAGQEPESYAVAYEKLLRLHLGDSGKFDLILSGMGDDGHTASLFPGTAVLHEKIKWVDAYYLAAQNMYRITLTAPLLNKARKNIVLVFGANKAHAFSEVIAGDRNPEKYPSQLLQPTEGGELIWFADTDASKDLPSAANTIQQE